MNRTHDFELSSQLSSAPRPSRAGEDDFVVLDKAILDTASPIMSPPFATRRESFADSVAAFLPSEGSWPVYNYGGEHVAPHPQENSAHGLPDYPGNTFPSSTTTHPMQYSQPTNWPLSATSGSCTPTADYDDLATEFDHDATVPCREPARHQAQAVTYRSLQLRTGSNFPPSTAFEASPQSTKDWLSASSPEGLDYHSAAPHASPHSPSFAANTLLLRRDGIRKKNARFEIPAERNLRTIDILINQTNDEQEIKELKQQKRLLRNRQAALDSRQRKKQHTERLEEEKKHYTTIISELEDALGEIKAHEAEWIHDKDSWATSQQHYKQYIDNLLIEKEELVRSHTIETGDLRKKNSILLEQVQRLENTAMSTAPSSTGFSADFSDFDHLTMDSSPWDNFSLANDFSIENDTAQLSSAIVDSKHPKSSLKDDDKATASGFLLMLLLCGAWVASRGPATSSSVLPTMPEDIRVASATVLDQIYQDAGITLEEKPCTGRPEVATATSVTNALSNERKTTLSAFEIANLSNTPLERLHHQLITPNVGQLREQAFSLTASQYNELSSDGNQDHEAIFNPNARRNIGDALAAVRDASGSSAADVYTRSLMWDRVPKDVVRDFARIIADSNAGTQGSWKTEPLN